jgi:O-antigen/teichoic acid export membrane protein
LPSGDNTDADVARSAGTAFLTQIVTAVFTAALTVFLVRRLGAAEFGVFSLALGIANLASLPADAGIAASAARYVAEHRDDDSAVRRVLATAIRLKVLSGVAVSIALALLAGPVADAYDLPTMAWTLRAMAVALFVQSLFTFFSYVNVALGRLDLNLRLVALESLVEAGASIALVLAAGGAAAAGWGRAIGYTVGAAVAVLLVLRRFGGGAMSMRRVADPPPIARYAGVMLVVNGIYSLFAQIDVLLIGALLSATAVGQFSAPLRLFALLYHPGLAIANAVAPRMARRAGHEPDVATLRHALRLLIIVHFALLAPFLVWAEPIVDLALGPDYEKSVDIVRVLALSIPVAGLAPLLSVSVNYLGEAGRRVPIAISALVVNVVIDLTLLREIGVVAAAIAALCGGFVYFAGHAVLCHRLLDLRPRTLGLTALRSLVGAAAMAGVLALFGTNDVSLPLMVAGSVAGLGAYAAMLVLTREVGSADVRFARSLLGR